jgi:hypothetical protein
MSLENTLGNKDWLKNNEHKIKELFPSAWTNIHELNASKLGSDLKNMAVDWRSKKEFEMIMVFLEKVGFIIRNGQTVKRNPKVVFPTSEY